MMGGDKRKQRTATLAAIVGVLIATNLASAQTTGMGRIAGRTTDRPGAALPGVVLTLDEGRFNRSAVSDEEGRYTFDDLAVDTTYTLHTEPPGFESQTFRDLSVAAGKTTTLDVRLGVGCNKIIDYIVMDPLDALLTTDTVVHIRVDANSVATRSDDQNGCRVIEEAPATVLGVVRTRAGELHDGSPIRIQSEDNAFKAGTEFLVMLSPTKDRSTFCSFKMYLWAVESGRIDGKPVTMELGRMRDEYRRYTRFRTYETLEPTMPLKKLRHQTGWVNLGRFGFGDDPWIDGLFFDFVHGAQAQDPLPHAGDRIRMKQPSPVVINDFGSRGEELRLEPPTERRGSVADLTGAGVDVGAVYRVADVRLEGSELDLRNVWVRLTPK